MAYLSQHQTSVEVNFNDPQVAQVHFDEKLKINRVYSHTAGSNVINTIWVSERSKNKINVRTSLAFHTTKAMEMVVPCDLEGYYTRNHELLLWKSGTL